MIVWSTFCTSGAYVFNIAFASRKVNHVVKITFPTHISSARTIHQNQRHAGVTQKYTRKYFRVPRQLNIWE